MARPVRPEYPGALDHVTVGNLKWGIVQSECAVCSEANPHLR
jgi:hypothetical protein